MPKKKETQGSKAEAIQSALAGLAEAKGITVEAVLDALHDAKAQLAKAILIYAGKPQSLRSLVGNAMAARQR